MSEAQQAPASPPKAAGKPQELLTVLLDVGPQMHPHLDAAGQGLSTLAHQKMVQKPQDRMRVVLFGATATANALHSQYAAGGSPGQYMHVQVAHPMAPTSLEHLRTLRHPPPGQGASDFVDALIVAADALVGDLGELSAAAAAGPRAKDPSASIRRRFVLLSNFLSPHTKGDPTGEVAAQLTGAMQAHAVSLEVVSLDAAAADAEGAGAKALNSRLLDAVCAEVEHSLRSVRHPDDLRALWPAHEFAGRALGLDLHIGSGARRLRIPVKFSNKAMRQSYPAMGKETPPAGAKAAGGGEEGDGGGEGGAPAAPRPSMARDTEFFRDDDEAQLHPIPAGERVRAYRYGKQLVPLAEADARFATYSVPKGMALVGFVPAAQIPRHYYMGSPISVWADTKGSPKPGEALAALVAALEAQGQVAILRCVFRNKNNQNGGDVSMHVASPVPASAAAPPHLLLNLLPFMEDVRAFAFGTFDRDDRRPSEAQQAAMDALVAALPLCRGPLEELAPAATFHPGLHHFLGAMTQRALDPGAPSTPEDPLVDRLLALRVGDDPEAVARVRAAVGAVAAAFPVGQGRAGGRAVHRLRRDHEEEDFAAMMEQENYNDAVSAFRKHIEAVVDSSVGEHRLREAADKTAAMRAACVAAGQAHAFNAHLRSLGGKYAGDPVKGAFWKILGERGVGPVGEGEVAGSPVTAAEAAAALEAMRAGKGG